MSDQTPDPGDDVLRAALHAEAEGVDAGPDLLDRIHAASRSTSSRWAGRAPWLLAAAAAAVVVAVGATVAMRDDDQTLDVVDNPSDTTSTTAVPTPTNMFDLLGTSFPCASGFQTSFYLSPAASASESDAVRTALETDARVQTVRFVSQADVVAALEDAAPEAEWDARSIPTAFLATSATEEDDIAVRGSVSDLPGVTATLSSDCTNPPLDPTGERPTVVALVREDGWLVLVDLSTGEETELHFGGDPSAPPSGQEEGGPQFIDDVDLSPDGQWVYFSTCCEPASGSTYRIPIGGGEPALFAVGAYPRLSPDGRFLATGAGDFVIITPVDKSVDAVTSVQLECCYSRLAWSPDGSQLAVVQGGLVDAPHEVVLFDWDGTTLTVGDTGKPDNPGTFVSWAADGTLSISSGDPVDDDLAMRQDASYEWILWVDEAGVIQEQHGHESADRVPIDGLPEALAADW